MLGRRKRLSSSANTEAPAMMISARRGPIPTGARLTRSFSDPGGLQGGSRARGGDDGANFGGIEVALRATQLFLNELPHAGKLFAFGRIMLKKFLRQAYS